MGSNSIQHYYEIYGDGIPLIFIHPPGMGHVVFHYQKSLSKYYKVILFDLRGHGKSSTSEEKATISLISEDILQFITHLGLEKVVICGYSTGGSIAQEFTINYPEKVYATILCGGFPEVNSAILKGEFLVGKWLASHNIPALANVLALSHMVTGEHGKMIRNYVLKTDKRVLENLYENGLLYKCTENLSAINTPFLLIYGDRDFYINKNQKLYERYIPHVETFLISNSFHQIPTKKAAIFNHAIHTFLKTLKTN
jgi:pimeloyl-ACP methyl ester carboxylesterase